MKDTTREGLARLILQTLDRQREYFRGRDSAVLAESKALERRLRAAATAVLNPRQEQPTLFGGTAG